MKYRLLGSSGLRVSELCLGTMTFGESWDFGASREESRAIFAAYRDAGGNFIDTANNYGAGDSETIVGEVLAECRQRFVLSTKYSLSMDLDDPNAGGNHRKNMRQALEASLRRLDTDYIDIFWLHVWDGVTGIDEVMRGLDDLVRSGKVLYIGVSDTPAWVVARGNTLAELRGWSQFIGLQTEYSLLERTPERELLSMARDLGLGLLAWSPLGAGMLTGKYKRDGEDIGVGDSLRADHIRPDRISERTMRIIDVLLAVAQEHERPPAQVALAWMRQREPGLIPIVGARTVAQLEQNLGCLELVLSGEELDRLDRISAVDRGFPHTFLSSPLLRRATFGDTFDRLDTGDRLVRDDGIYTDPIAPTEVVASGIRVWASLTAVPGKRADLVAAFREILPVVRAKRGCLEYALASHADSGLAGQSPHGEELLIVETWADLDALRAHVDDPEFLRWFGGIVPLIETTSMQVLELD